MLPSFGVQSCHWKTLPRQGLRFLGPPTSRWGHGVSIHCFQGLRAKAMCVPPPNSSLFSSEAEDSWALIFDSLQAYQPGALALGSHVTEKQTSIMSSPGDLLLVTTASITR